MPINEKAWKLLAESKIEQAITEGQFSGLPGFGKPLDVDPDQSAQTTWQNRKARQENLETLPPAMVLKREVERRTDRIMQLKSEPQVRQALEDLNQWIKRANMKVLWGPPSEIQPLDIEAFIARWQQL
ncbi:MAG: DUF1992 domain-containing protein [Pirellulaceae bacterium]|nr:DUF1992 domain-containing protein [Pirellulaceae bacterium]